MGAGQFSLLLLLLLNAEFVFTVFNIARRKWVLVSYWS